MINSDFDTIIGNNNQMPTKGNKLKVFIIIFLIILLIAAGAFVFLKYRETEQVQPKTEFMKYVGQTNSNKIFNVDLFTSIADKLGKTGFTIKNNILTTSTIDNVETSDYSADLNIYKNNNNEGKIDLVLNKLNSKVIDFNLLFDNEKIALKSDDIVNRYVGSKYENLQQLEEKIFLNSTEQTNEVEVYEQEELQNEDIDDTAQPMNTVNETTLSNTINDSNNEDEKIQILDKSVLEKYKNILNEKLTSDKFTVEKGVTLTQNSKSVQADLYELKISNSDISEIITNLKNELLNDDELINSIVTGNNNDFEIQSALIKVLNGNKIDTNSRKFKQQLAQWVEQIENYLQTILGNSDVKIDLYVNNGNVIKKTILIGNIFELDIQPENKSPNENSVRITGLYTDKNSENYGISLVIDRIDNDISTKINAEISLIENKQINNKIVVEFSLEGNENSKDLKNNLIITYSNTSEKLEIKLNSTIDFENGNSIDKLNDDNCLFLDELNDDELEQVISAISYASQEVYKQKMDEFIDGNVVPEDNSQTLTPNENEDELAKKEEAKNKLIKAVQDDMVKAEEEGREYTLMDLQQLKIEGATYTVALDENMAVIAVDGYSFYIDPNFNLSE